MLSNRVNGSALRAYVSHRLSGEPSLGFFAARKRRREIEAEGQELLAGEREIAAAPHLTTVGDKMLAFLLEEDTRTEAQLKYIPKDMD